MYFLIVSAISFTLLAYPYFIYPVLLRLLPRRPYFPACRDSGKSANAALVFCAHNEEQSLPEKIANIRQLRAICPDLEVRAYTDHCTDRSVELLRAAADVILLHEGKERAGKAAGMRELVGSTTADIVIFTDANVLLDVESLPRLMAYFRNPDIATVAGTLHYTNSSDSHVAYTGSLYWRLEERIKRLESETGSTMGADGSIFAMRRLLYPDVPPNLLDDMVASITPMFLGHRVVSAPDVHAFEKSTTDGADEFRRKRRIACRSFRTHQYLAPRLARLSVLNRFKYMSHKYLRWFSAIFLALGVAFALAGLAQLASPGAAGAVVALGGLLFGLGNWLKISLLNTASVIVVSMVAVAIGVAEALSGRDYQVWNPSKSR